MARIYFNSRDEMTCIETDLIALVKADGNYSQIIYINGKVVNIIFGISKLVVILKEKNDRHNHFVKLGRSYIINHHYVHKIDLLKLQLVLSDGDKNNIRIALPKKTLKAYKDAISQKVKLTDITRRSKDGTSSNS